MSDSGSDKPSDTPLTRARSKAREAIDAADAQRKYHLFKQRLELARSGVIAYRDLKNPTEAVIKFKTYLRILEEWKGIQDGALTPEIFDTKKEVAELLLVSGVYWDLAKIYDKTRTPEKYQEFRGFLEKFVLFSRGQKFQSVSVETLRRYISHNKGFHKADFKQAFELLGGSNRCFVATSLAELLWPETMPRLRRFRDLRLKRSRLGRDFVAVYYRRGPGLAEWMNRRPEWARRVTARGLDLVAWVLDRN